MKINDTIDKCIELMYKKIEEQEFNIKYYPELVSAINNDCEKDDKLDKKELDDLINKRIKEYEIKIVEWKIHLNNIKSIKYETN
jgi:hypothetical protein